MKSFSTDLIRRSDYNGGKSKFSKAITKVVISTLLVCALIPMTVFAYNLDSTWAKPSGDVTYGVSSAAGSKFGFTTIESAIESWNYSGSPLDLSRRPSPYITDVMIYYTNNTSGSYGVASAKGTVITFYADMDDLNSTRKKETMVHEIGHTLGLDHTQTSNNSISVMRALGFNDKAYPLKDDKNGINVLY